MDGFVYAQLDVGDAKAIEDFEPSFDRLDVLIIGIDQAAAAGTGMGLIG